MIYTMAGSLGLLLAIQMIGVVAGHLRPARAVSAAGLRWHGQSLLWACRLATVKAIAFWAFAIAFAIKVPVWPFHTWLPDAHTEAPTAGSMILAGVLLKLGAYGFLRLVLPLYPAEAKHYAGALAFLAVMAIIFGALASFGQDDFKRLVAYSSVNHMGFVVLGIAAAAYAAGTAGRHHRPERGGAADVQPRPLGGGHVLPGRRDLRAHAHPQPERIRRPVPAGPGLWRHPDLHLHGFAGSARPERLCLRIPGGAGLLAGLHRCSPPWR